MVMSYFHRLEMKLCKGSSGGWRLCYCCDKAPQESQQRFYLPSGVYFIKTVKGKVMHLIGM